MSDDGASGSDGGGTGRSGSSGGGMGEDIQRVDAALREQFSWYVVAKKEFKDTVRSKLLWLLSAIFVIVFALPAFLGLYFGLGQIAQQQGATLTTDAFFGSAARLGSALIPLVAIVVGYASIVGERKSGSLKVLLSLPFSRGDVVVGKVIGRSAVVAIPILIGFLVSVAVLLPANVALNAVGFVLAALLTALLGVVFVSLAVGISAAARTGRRAIVGTVGIYVYFFLFWNSFANSIGGLLGEYLNVTAGTAATTSLFVKLVNPTQSYQTLVDAALGNSALTARATMFQGLRIAGICEQALGGNVSMSQGAGISCQSTGAGVPFYFSNVAVLVYFLLWIVVPVALGYRLFDGADL